MTLTAAEVVSQPVQDVQVLDTPSGPVGYLSFTAHLAPAEAQLVDAVRRFESDAVVDLVVDTCATTAAATSTSPTSWPS